MSMKNTETGARLVCVDIKEDSKDLSHILDGCNEAWLTGGVRFIDGKQPTDYIMLNAAERKSDVLYKIYTWLRTLKWFKYKNLR